ncbi:glycosyltransferase [Bythopirellula goksoeyrii]|uniref:Glycosyltransferase subfamily 4-like N-terminal domain-containing protein n=1 Tax=Bythopirellula goksoeyrii TaxID=1400387 RepID=A0A5B9QAF1_9BACT|nr:glycosyltransferase [Bythopirellula goksoeyrii]QEG36044.1 hypothetical protein Pr1d_33530 [Bythopirellula goksoeyrii]
MAKLLIVTPFFPPSAASGSFRILGFAKHLPKFGWDVTVVSSGSRPWEANDPELINQIPPQTSVRYVDFPLERARLLWHQVLQRFRIKGCTDVWNRPALKECRIAIEKDRTDVVLTSGPPHNVHLIGRSLQRQYSLPWVADFRDPWCSWGNETPYFNNHFLLEHFWERSVFQRASMIVANTENTARMFKELFPGVADRIVAVPNGYDPMGMEPIAPERKHHERFTLLHTGMIYAGRNPQPIVEALRQLTMKGGIHGKTPVLRLLGKCFDDSLRIDLERLGLLRWVEFADSVSYLEAAKEARLSDMLVLLDSPGRRIGVPAKLYEYLGSCRPILALSEKNSDSALVLQKSGVAHRVVSDFLDIEHLSEVIKNLAEETTAMRPAKDNSFLNSLTRESNAQKLSHALKSVMLHKNTIR